ncbi:MAG: hypothetical protein ABRQ37_08135 [Candidatus Eremiobacterota bacterium]
MECPRCRSKIPHGAIACPECAKPLATFPVSALEKKQGEGFNPMWIVYGLSGCLFLVIAFIAVVIILMFLFSPG